MHQNKNPHQSPWQRRRQQRRQQDDQLATERKQALDASAPRLRNLFIFVQVFLLYVVVSIFGVDDRDLLDPNSMVSLPLLNISVPTFYFFLLAPALVALLHINLLLHHQAYQDKLRHWRDGDPKAQLDQLAPNFFDIAFLAQDRWQRQLVRASLWLLLYFWPPAALCLALFWFADYQNPWITLQHFVLLIISYGASVYFSQQQTRVSTELKNLQYWLQHLLLGALPLNSIYVVMLVVSLTWISYELSHPWFKSNLLYRPNIDAPSFIYQKLDSATIDLAKAYESNISRDELIKSYSEPLDLRGRSLRYADLSSSFLPKARLAAADLAGAYLVEARLQGANLREAQLPGADLLGAQLPGADLIAVQLQGAVLRGAQLQGANLRAAQLQGTNLWAAQLQGADLRGAQLQGALLSGAQLQGAGLFAAQLQGTDLRAAQLQGADFSSAQLQGANLAGAQLHGVWSDYNTVPYMYWTGDRRKLLTLLKGSTSDLSGVNRQELSAEAAAAIIAELESVKLLDDLSFINTWLIDNAIHRIRAAVGKPWTLEGSGAITGVLTQEMIDEILEQWDD